MAKKGLRHITCPYCRKPIRIVLEWGPCTADEKDTGRYMTQEEIDAAPGLINANEQTGIEKDNG